MEEGSFLKRSLVFYVPALKVLKDPGTLDVSDTRWPVSSRASLPQPGDKRGVTSQSSGTHGKVTSQFCLWHSTSSSALPKGNVTTLMMCPKPPKYQPGEGRVTLTEQTEISDS